MSHLKEEVKPEVAHVELVSDHDDHESDKFSTTSRPELLIQARKATEEEHELTVARALKEYFPSCLWSMVMSSTIIMEGYDLSIMSNFFAYDTFKRKYGVEISPGRWEIEGKWQSALGCAALVGTIIALFFNGILVERYGHRKIILYNLAFMGGFLFITFFAQNVEMLLVGQILCGFPWGFFSVIGLIYASEIAPLPLRSFLSAYVMMCWATGQLIASGVLQGFSSMTSQWSYRVPFAIQWVWIPPILIATLLCPDSPYWLVRRGEYDKAEKMIKRLSHKSVHFKAKQKLNLIIYTNELEKDTARELDDKYKGWKSYLECFKGANRRRTEIACMSISSQVFGGNNFAYMPTYLFAQVGLSQDVTYNLNLGITAVAWVGTFCSWFIATRVGRRKIFIIGLFFMTLFLLLIGIFQYPADSNPDFNWAQVACTFAWCVSFVLSLAPLAYTITSEVSSTRLRAQTIAIGRNAYNIVSLLSAVISPYWINPTELDLKGRTAFIWFGTSFCALVWAFFRLPETKDRTYEELDVLFEKRIPARKFGSYKLNLDKEELEGGFIA